MNATESATERATAQLNFYAGREGSYEELLADLAKKAKKLGTEPPREISREHYLAKIHIDAHTTREEPRIRAEVEYEVIRIADGWRFLGTIERGPVEDLAIVATTGEVVADPAWTTWDFSCEHCGHKRQRNQCLILKRDDEIKIVGSTCIKDFTGINPAHLLSALQFEAAFKVFTDEDEIYPRSGPPVVWDTRGLVLRTLAVIRVDGGYINAATARDRHCDSTSATVVRTLTERCPLNERDRKAWEEEQAKLASTPEEKAITDEIIAEWLVEKDEIPKLQDEFARNLAIAALGEWWPLKRTAILAGGTFGFLRRRSLAEEKKRQAEATAHRTGENEHFGTVGKREVFKIEVDRVHSFENDWGVTLIIGGVLAGTNSKFVWFCKGDDQGLVAPGSNPVREVVEVKATVKNHEDHPRFGKQTILQRVTRVRLCDDCGTDKAVKLREVVDDRETWRCNKCEKKHGQR